ncbi:MAG: DUF2188 domain-containing protein [Cyanobacteria bacterium]|nr:DUF2188 domain-containing protein [Cyanobacteriota bacterium]
MTKKSTHVVPRNVGWAVKKEGASRASKNFTTQADAVKFAKELAQKEKAELYVHRRDGTIRDRLSYRNDPFPPKDKA